MDWIERRLASGKKRVSQAGDGLSLPPRIAPDAHHPNPSARIREVMRLFNSLSGPDRREALDLLHWYHWSRCRPVPWPEGPFEEAYNAMSREERRLTCALFARYRCRHNLR
jgi:hypothetical protein